MRTDYAPVESYTGNNTLAEYGFDFKIESLAQLLFVVLDSSNDEIHRVRGNALNSFFSSVEFDEEVGGGSVTLAANLATNYKLFIFQANDAPTQPNQYRDKFSFTLKSFEMALDFIVGAVQRVSWLSQRSIRLNDAYTGTTFDMQLPLAPTANSSLVFSSDGLGIVLGPTAAELTQAATDAETAMTAAQAAQTAAELAETNAETAEALAEDWASKTDGIVDATDYSSRAWAIGGTGVTETAARGSAKDWATKAHNSLVDTSEYSAKHYATEAALSAAAAATGAAQSGTRGTPNDITAAGGLSVSDDAELHMYVQGNGGAITVTANPQIEAGTNIGQKLLVIGRSDTNTLTLANGTGLSLNGDITLGEDDNLYLYWDGTNWSEISRRDT